MFKGEWLRSAYMLQNCTFHVLLSFNRGIFCSDFVKKANSSLNEEFGRISFCLSLDYISNSNIKNSNNKNGFYRHLELCEPPKNLRRDSYSFGEYTFEESRQPTSQFIKRTFWRILASSQETRTNLRHHILHANQAQNIWAMDEQNEEIKIWSSYSGDATTTIFVLSTA